MLDELKKTISSTIRQDYAGHCVYLRLPKRGKTKHQNKASPWHDNFLNCPNHYFSTRPALVNIDRSKLPVELQLRSIT